MPRGGSTSGQKKKNRVLRDEPEDDNPIGFSPMLCLQLPALPPPPSFVDRAVPSASSNDPHSSSDTEDDGEEDEEAGNDTPTVGRGPARPMSPLPEGQKLNCTVAEK